MVSFVCTLPAKLREMKGGDLQRNGPIRLCKCPDNIWAMCGKDVVNRVNRGNNASASGLRGAAGQPAYHVAGFLVVK